MLKSSRFSYNLLVFDIEKLTLPVLTELELKTKFHFGSDQLQFQGMKSFFIDQVSLKHTS